MLSIISLIIVIVALFFTFRNKCSSTYKDMTGDMYNYLLSYNILYKRESIINLMKYTSNYVNKQKKSYFLDLTLIKSKVV